MTGSAQHSAMKDRKSTRLNSSHGYISYAVFCLKKKIALIALVVTIADQLTQEIVRHTLEYASGEKVIIPGFFKFVHWGNTGAAWSLFRDNNLLLATIAVFALLVLFLSRHHFDARSLLGQLAFGLICGGILGNLIDRLWAKHVIDFLYFYLQQR